MPSAILLPPWLCLDHSLDPNKRRIAILICWTIKDLQKSAANRSWLFSGVDYIASHSIQTMMQQINIRIKSVSILLAALVLTTSCMSRTMIQSEPSGAKVYLDGEPVGHTPYTHSDTKIVGTCMTVRLEKDGYDTFNTSICRNEEADAGAIVGGIFLLFPFLWTMKYKPTHTYELLPSSENFNDKAKESGEESTIISASKIERLRELKKLLDEGVLTQEKFEKEKKKILEEK